MMFLLVACQTTPIEPESHIQASNKETQSPEQSTDALPVLILSIPQVCFLTGRIDKILNKFNEKIVMTWVVDNEDKETERRALGMLTTNDKTKTLTVAYTARIVNKATGEAHPRLCVAMTGINMKHNNKEVKILYNK